MKKEPHNVEFLRKDNNIKKAQKFNNGFDGQNLKNQGYNKSHKRLILE